MSAYPTSAQLAAFRRSIASPMDLVWDAAGLAITSYFWDDSQDHPADGGATSDELQHGIGYHPFDGDGPSYVNTDANLTSHARREASAMRSRAYARRDSLEPMDSLEWNAAVRTFQPSSPVS